jgi:hypothetical protein
MVRESRVLPMDTPQIPVIGVLCQCTRTLKNYTGWKRHAKTCEVAGNMPVSIDGKTMKAGVFGS